MNYPSPVILEKRCDVVEQYDLDLVQRDAVADVVPFSLTRRQKADYLF
ncbi:MAG: hypothetical protein ACRD4J_02475 [Nitrososphaeraceae archaeon]